MGFLLKVWRHPRGRIGVILLSVIVLTAVFAPFIAPFDPYDVDQRDGSGLPPSGAHLLGTTSWGEDIFSMLIFGSRVSLGIGLVTGLLIACIGALMGILAGYVGRAVDMLIMRIVDVMLVIPTLPITIVLTNLFGKSYMMLIFIFTLFGWTGLARVIRSQVLVLKTSNYVKAADLSGAGKWYIMFRHILPGVSNLLIMSTALTSAGIMVAEAGLSFLGLGDPKAISWGKMLAEAQSGGALMLGYWWWVIAPGIAIFITVSSFMLIGYALEEIFNPKMRQSNSIFKLFKSLNNTYIQEIFASMNASTFSGGHLSYLPGEDERDGEGGNG